MTKKLSDDEFKANLLLDVHKTLSEGLLLSHEKWTGLPNRYGYSENKVTFIVKVKHEE